MGAIVVAHRPDGDVHLADIATIRRGMLEPQSAYHGNGQPAIAVNIQRAQLRQRAAHHRRRDRSVLPELEKSYPGIAFSIPDTQGELINLSVGNMLDALRDAVIMTVIVIFLFLADLRGMTLAAISIPFTYLLTFAVMWLIGYEFNMVTLTAVIIAVGMLLDDAIVVLENIERHYHEEGRGRAQGRGGRHAGSHAGDLLRHLRHHDGAAADHLHRRLRADRAAAAVGQPRASRWRLPTSFR